MTFKKVARQSNLSWDYQAEEFEEVYQCCFFTYMFYCNVNTFLIPFKMNAYFPDLISSLLLLWLLSSTVQGKGN